MRILITGSNGMLGSDLVKELSPHYEVSGISRKSNRHSKIEYLQTDITNRSAVFKSISTLKPAIIIHAAAYTDVDGCESNPYLAYSTNVKATEYISEASNQQGATLFFISTDYVFDGTKSAPYEETDSPNPISVYGRSKYEAEEFLKSHARSAWILRSSWLFGADGRNFFNSILNRMQKGEELKVVNDQRGAPTYTKDLAYTLRILVEKGKRPKGCVIYHIANSGETTWFGAAKMIMEKAESSVRITPISSEDLNRPAKRPKSSIFNLNRIKIDYGIQLRNWKEAVDEFWVESLSKQWESN